MKNKLIKLLIVLVLQIGVLGLFQLAAADTYTTSWTSVDKHPAAPEWFQDAKLGLWYHWGAYSVPAYGSEWYPRNMYNQGSGEYNHHLSVFGDPYSNWPYHNFINGANNKAGVYTQFAPKLKSQGGKFDPDEWAQLFVDAGAKMAGPVAEHHDGYSLWNSTCNEWNSVKKGPGLDLTGLFATAFRAKGLKFLVSTHTAYNFTSYYQWVPAQSDPSLKKLYGQLPKAEEEQLWLNKEKELIDLYQPDYMWHDFNMGQVSETVRLNYLAYYYNKAIDWGKEVVVSYNDGFNTRGEVQQVERGGYANTTYPFWLSEDTVSASTWCYTQGMGYYSAKSILHALIDRVSKNGCLLLDICPMADGTIPQTQKDILINMGNWLKKNGEAIYATRAYTKFGEGPTQMGGGGMGAPKEGTATDIRFTKSKDNTALYAIGLGWPSNNQMVITSLKSGSFDSSKISGITFLNGGGSCTWTQDGTGLKVNLPSNLSDNMGYAVKIALNGAILSGVTFYQDYDFAGNAVTLTAGNYTQSQLAAAGIANNSVSSIRVPGGIQVEVYDGDNFSGSKWTFTTDNANFGSVGCNDVMSSVKIISIISTPTPTVISTPTPTPGPQSAFSQLEAENYSSMSGIQTETCNEGGEDVGYIENGDYIAFSNLDFGNGAGSFQARVASATSGGSIELRLGSSTGTLIGTCPVAGTGDWQTWTTVTCNVSGVSGMKNLYLVFSGESGYLCNFNWFRFVAASAPTPTPVGTKGDVNGDGTVDIVDALMTAQYSVGLTPAGFVAANADVNCDGSITIVDALMVAQYYVGLVTGFPC